MPKLRITARRLTMGRMAAHTFFFGLIMIDRFHQDSEILGLIPTAVVSLVLSFAFLAHAIGAPVLLGGFAAGLALSRRFSLPLGRQMARDQHFATLFAPFWIKLYCRRFERWIPAD